MGINTYSSILNVPLNNFAVRIFRKLTGTKDKAIGNDSLVVERAWGRCLVTVHNLALGRHFGYI